jgi:hypothetical protein
MEDILVATAYDPRRTILGIAPGGVNSNDAPGNQEERIPKEHQGM